MTNEAEAPKHKDKKRKRDTGEKKGKEGGSANDIQNNEEDDGEAEIRKKIQKAKEKARLLDAECDDEKLQQFIRQPRHKNGE